MGIEPQIDRAGSSAAPVRREALKAKVIKKAKSTASDIQNAVVKKILDEVQSGTMGPARSDQFLRNKYGPFWNGCQRFGIQQGTKDNGQPKFRCIDNHATSGVSDAAERRQKICMANISGIMLLIRAAEKEFISAGLLGPTWELRGSTEDLKAG